MSSEIGPFVAVALHPFASVTDVVLEIDDTLGAELEQSLADALNGGHVDNDMVYEIIHNGKPVFVWSHDHMLIFGDTLVPHK